jgi:hypothetical protein
MAERFKKRSEKFVDSPVKFIWIKHLTWEVGDGGSC